MKIVMICDFFNETLDYQENLVAKYYIKYGHEVVMITSTFDSVFSFISDSHDNSRPAKTYSHDGVKIIRLPYRWNILNRLRAFQDLGEILEREKPTLLFAHDITLNFPDFVRYMRRNRQCRMIMDYHADYSNSGRGWLSLRVLHRIIRKYHLDCARPHLSRIFPVTPASAVFLKEVYGVRDSEMELLPLGADSDVGQATKTSEAGRALRREWGIPAGDIVIFTGGKLTPAKRTELAIEAVAKLKNPKLHLIVVGDAGPADSEYKSALTTLAAGMSNIRFVGWQDKESVFRYLDMADFAVFPASQSILWQQAISMGLPLVAGDTGHQDISYLNLYQNIIILRGKDISAPRLERVIADLAGNRDKFEAMRTGARRVADECLDWNKLILRTLRFSSGGPS